MKPLSFGIPRGRSVRSERPCGTDPKEIMFDIDQIREVLIQANYLSRKDAGICLGFDIGTLADQPSFPDIKALYESLVDEYA